jgi:hypothetical protein
MLATVALVYPSQGGRYHAEGCVVCGSDSSVVKDPLGEIGRTPWYVDLPSAWCAVDGGYVFSPLFVGGLLFGNSDRYK